MFGRAVLGSPALKFGALGDAPRRRELVIQEEDQVEEADRVHNELLLKKQMESREQEALYVPMHCFGA